MQVKKKIKFKYIKIKLNGVLKYAGKKIHCIFQLKNFVAYFSTRFQLFLATPKYFCFHLK